MLFGKILLAGAGVSTIGTVTSVMDGSVVGAILGVIGIGGAAVVGLISRFDATENKRQADRLDAALRYERARADSAEARASRAERELAVYEDRDRRRKGLSTPDPDHHGE